MKSTSSALAGTKQRLGLSNCVKCMLAVELQTTRSSISGSTNAMAIISSFTLIRTISLFHLTAAYFFLTAPRTIADQNVVFIIGESIRLV